MAYWVVGGEYSDMRFETAAPGQTLEKHGPFETYQDAYKVWSGRAWATVDNCQCRFQVIEGDQVAA